MAEVKLSVITINLNNAEGLEKTLKSLNRQDKRYFELIIVDGCSKDRSHLVMEAYQELIDVKIIEKDNGIFDAMNKGVRAAAGEWLFFLNSGDELADITFAGLGLAGYHDKDVLYGDVMHFRYNNAYRIVCNHKKGVLNHQALMYRRKWHDLLGLYNTGKTFKIADYFFFCQIPESLFCKLDAVFSKAQPGGVSETKNILQDRLDVDYYFNKVSFFSYIWKSVLIFGWRKVQAIFKIAGFNSKKQS